MTDIIDQLIRHEGLKLKPYLDTVGKTTIGVGRNLDDVGITEEEARYLLANDIARVRADLDRKLPWWRTLDPVRQRVLEDMCFNLGIVGLRGFKNTLAAVQDGRFRDAAKGMLASKWARQVGQRAVTLSDMMRKGE